MSSCEWNQVPPLLQFQLSYMGQTGQRHLLVLGVDLPSEGLLLLPRRHTAGTSAPGSARWGRWAWWPWALLLVLLFSLLLLLLLLLLLVLVPAAIGMVWAQSHGPKLARRLAWWSCSNAQRGTPRASSCHSPASSGSGPIGPGWWTSPVTFANSLLQDAIAGGYTPNCCVDRPHQAGHDESHPLLPQTTSYASHWTESSPKTNPPIFDTLLRYDPLWNQLSSPRPILEAYSPRQEYQAAKAADCWKLPVLLHSGTEWPTDLWNEQLENSTTSAKQLPKLNWRCTRTRTKLLRMPGVPKELHARNATGWKRCQEPRENRSTKAHAGVKQGH